MASDELLSVTIGVLALQGAFREHISILRALGVEAREVRTPTQLVGIDGLIIPGGESTTMGLVAERSGMVEPLRNWVAMKMPTWGTCAGMIMLSNEAEGAKEGGQTLLGGMNIKVHRNFFGSQIRSFESLLDISAVNEVLGIPSENKFAGVFIRAPAVTDYDSSVQVLAEIQLQEEREGKTSVPVAVEQEGFLATAFHPELTNDTRWHQYFIHKVAQVKCKQVVQD